MKIRNRIVQSRRRQIGQKFLELPESLSRLKGLSRRLDGVERPSFFDENINTPKIALIVAIIRLPIVRRNQRKHAAARVGLADGFFSKVRRHALDVLHQRRRIFENVMIDALNNVADARAALIENRAIGVIDVTAAIRIRSKKFATQGELRRHGAEVVSQIRVHFNLGGSVACR
jgi:hypothetical protein